MTLPNVYLVVWWFDRFGGMERHVTDIAIALRRSGSGVTVFSESPIAPSNRYLKELQAAGIRVHAPGKAAQWLARMERWRLYRLITGLDRTPKVGWVGMEDEYLRHQHSPPFTRVLLRTMEREAQRSAPDVVHVHGCRLGQHRVLQWASSRGRPCVYSEHLTISDWGGPSDPESPWIVGSTADALACVSVRSRDSLQDHLPWQRTIHVARHIIPDPRLRNPAAGQPRNPDECSIADKVSLLAVGRLSPHKGYETLLHAASMLRDEGFDLDVKIAGSGEQLDELIDLRAKLKLDEAVSFLGQMEQAQVLDLWREADIGVVPSLTEGLPLTVVEAMAQARPIVASRVGGIPEVIEHEVNGLLVRAGDAGELSAAIRRIIRDPGLAARLAKGARSAFETGGWSEQSVVEQTLSIYDDATRSRVSRKSLAGGTDRGWALDQATEAARPLKRVCLFIWSLSSFGDMEYLVTQQAMALASAGVDVLLFVATSIRPFNAYVRSMRRAGVKVISPTLPGSLAQRAWMTLSGSGSASPLAAAFSRTCASGAPDAIQVHGWRLSSGWIKPLFHLATERGIRSVYCEHAVEDEGQPPPGETDHAVILMADGLAAASAPAADYLYRTLGRDRPIAVLRHAGRKRPDPPMLVLDRSAPFKVFSLLTPAQASELQSGADPALIRVDPAGPESEWSGQIAASDAVILSQDAEGFGRALVEAMASFRPVVVFGRPEDIPIRHQANGLVVGTDPAGAVLELAGDPVLAHHYSVAARRTYELGGLHDLAVVWEAVALFRRGSRAEAPQ